MKLWRRSWILGWHFAERAFSPARAASFTNVTLTLTYSSLVPAVETNTAFVLTCGCRPR